MSAALRAALLWTRGLIFTALVPLVIAGWVPAAVDPFTQDAGSWADAGWALVAGGAVIYMACLTRFLSSGGTPAIFFTRPVRAVIGEEPPELVQAWLYAFSRNPMYVAVTLAVFGQAIVYRSTRIAIYGALLWLTFHVVVIALEEPHLRDRYGPAYAAYCRRVPRWLGMPRWMVF